MTKTTELGTMIAELASTKPGALYAWVAVTATRITHMLPAQLARHAAVALEARTSADRADRGSVLAALRGDLRHERLARVRAALSATASALAVMNGNHWEGESFCLAYACAVTADTTPPGSAGAEWAQKKVLDALFKSLANSVAGRV